MDYQSLSAEDFVQAISAAVSDNELGKRNKKTLIGNLEIMFADSQGRTQH